MTAAVVAASLLLLEEHETLGVLVRDLPLEDIDRAIRIAIPTFGWLRDTPPWRLVRRLAWSTGQVISPGFGAHYALRKYEVRQQLLRSIEMGFRQVVLIGPGFDMLGSSLPASARIIEVDHPATQRMRRSVLRAAHQEKIVFVAADLATDGLREALDACDRFDASAKTAYAAEGVLMYLAADRVHSILADSHVTTPGRDWCARC